MTKRTAKDLVNDINYNRNQLGLPPVGYHGTSRTALLVINSRYARLLKEWTTALKPRNIAPATVVTQYGLTENEAVAFVTFAKNR